MPLGSSRKQAATKIRISQPVSWADTTEMALPSPDNKPTPLPWANAPKSQSEAHRVNGTAAGVACGL